MCVMFKELPLNFLLLLLFQIYLGCTKKMISYLVVTTADSKESLGHQHQVFAIFYYHLKVHFTL